MKVCLYLESSGLLSRSGLHSAYRNHCRALTLAQLDYTTDPNGPHDLLHLHWFGPRSVRLLARAKRKGIPVVISTHSIGKYDFTGGFTGTSLLAPAYQQLLHGIYRRADALFAPSRFAQRVLAEQGLGPVYVVSNGVDLARWQGCDQRRRTWRDRLRLTGFTAYCAGNVLPRKGVLEFIEVARRLPRHEFLWFGQRWGPLAFYPRMERAIRRAPANVRFVGFVDKPEAAYDACDLFFFPTAGESQGLACLEAAALGKPLVLQDVPAFSDLESGQDCLKASTVDEHCAHIAAVSADAELRDRLAQASRKLAREHDLARVGRRLAELYALVMAGKEEACARW